MNFFFLFFCFCLFRLKAIRNFVGIFLNCLRSIYIHICFLNIPCVSWFQFFVISDSLELDLIKSICTFAFIVAHPGATVGCFLSFHDVLSLPMAFIAPPISTHTPLRRGKRRERERKSETAESFLFICFSASAAIKLNCQSQRVDQVDCPPVRSGSVYYPKNGIAYPTRIRTSIRVVSYR